MRLPFLLFAAALQAHYTWIAPLSPRLILGQPSRIVIAHGHEFPQGEEAINAQHVRAFAVTPSGRRVPLAAQKEGSSLQAVYTAREPGTHQIGFVEDRGIVSRTSKGLQPGGRDVHAEATQAFRLIRTATGFASTGPILLPGRPAGLALELMPKIQASAITLTALRDGKPLAGVPVSVVLQGQEDAAPVGASDAKGQVVFLLKPGVRPPALFLCDVKEPAPAGATFDVTNLSTSLYLVW